MSYTFTKSVCERYDIRFRHEWAIFTIDENGGLFNCHSSYGNYSYSWPRHGRKSFKHFVLELARDYSYFLGKVSDNNCFNLEESSRLWKKQIIQMRKECDCSKEDAREAWDFIDGLDSSMSYDYTATRVIDNDAINKIWREPWVSMEFIKEFPAEAVIFAKEVMPMFAEILKQEIEQAEQGNMAV